MRGLTLAEIIVGAAITALLTGMLVLIFHTSQHSFRRGSTRMHSQQLAREAVRRTTPLVMSAVPPSPLEDAVYLPAIGELGPALEFYSADDLFNPTATVDPRIVTPHLYRIRHNPANGEVLFEELAAPARTPLGPSRVLARQIYALDFERLEVNLVRVRVETLEMIRGATGQQEEQKVERRSVVSIPFYSGPRS